MALLGSPRGCWQFAGARVLRSGFIEWAVLCLTRLEIIDIRLDVSISFTSYDFRSDVPYCLKDLD